MKSLGKLLMRDTKNDKFQIVKISSAKNCIETLQAPGKGLLTVSTSIANPGKMLGSYFGKESYLKWIPRVQNLEMPIVIGYPCDTGSGIVRGSAYGPVFLREALYQKKPIMSVNDMGDIPVVPQLLHDSMLSKKQISATQKYLYADGVKGPISPLSLLEETLVEIFKQNPNAKTFIMGGDHSAAGAVMRAYKRGKKMKGLALLQIDAHTDLLHERFGVEHCFATWTANAMPYFQNSKAVVQVGIRASRRVKSRWEKDFGLKQYWAKDVRHKSAIKFGDALLKHWKKIGCDKLYISNDIDGTDAMEAPCTGTPELYGLKSKWVCELLKHLSSKIEVVGMDMVEVAPVLHGKAAQRKTLKAAVDQILAVKW